MKTDLKKYSLAEIFKQSAAEYSQNFGWLDDLIILSDKGAVYISENMAEDLKYYPQEFKSFVREEIRELKEEDVQSEATLFNYMSSLPYNFATVAINLSSPSEIFDSGDYSKSKSKIFEFDHEFGHLIAEQPYKINRKMKKEAIADIFALLMHVKRFGNDDLSLFDEIAGVNATYPITNKTPDYYCPNAIFAVKSLAKETDISKLSIKQIARCATQIGNNFTVSTRTLKSIHKTYQPARELYHDDDNYDHEDVLEAVATIMLENKHKPETYRAGRLYLSIHQNDVLIQKMKTYNCFWSKTLKEMKEHEEKTGFNPDSLEKNLAVTKGKKIIPFINKKPSPKLRMSV